MYKLQFRFYICKLSIKYFYNVKPLLKITIIQKNNITHILVKNIEKYIN